MTIVPNVMPMFESAWGMARTPAPTIVFTRLITEDSHDAEPPEPSCFECREPRPDREEVLAGLELPCSLGELVIAAYEAMIAMDFLERFLFVFGVVFVVVVVRRGTCIPFASSACSLRPLG